MYMLFQIPLTCLVNKLILIIYVKFILIKFI